MMSKSGFGVLALRLADLDLDRYFFHILVLADSDRMLTQKELAEVVGFDKTAMVRVVDYLAEKGYLERKTNPKDRREQFVVLTAKGRRDAPKIKAAVNDVNQAAMRGIGPEHAGIFLSCLDIIARNFDSLPKEKIHVRFRKSKPQSAPGDAARSAGGSGPNGPSSKAKPGKKKPPAAQNKKAKTGIRKTGSRAKES
jgi:MarR family transcriptional regulator for hemolysin